MDSQLIDKMRQLISDGQLSRTGLARAAGLHANTLRDIERPQWNPTAETLRKLEDYMLAHDDSTPLVAIENIIEEARNGRMFILVDDENRENEGDLVIAAQMVTPKVINFMATHGRGLICLALTQDRVDQLGLQLMSKANGTQFETAFTTSIEARTGVTTGISAADRARTISVAIDASKGSDDITTPGHVFPLIARAGGVIVRAGHTEAAVDIARLAGLNPSGVICEIMAEDGSMARMDTLLAFARRHQIKIGTIRDLIAYRMRYDHLVERCGESLLRSDYGGEWRTMIYRNTLNGSVNVVLQKGTISDSKPTLVRMHRVSLFDDVLGQSGKRKRLLQRSMQIVGEAVGAEDAGLIVLLFHENPAGLQAEVERTPPRSGNFRSYGIGAQILADLGVHDMILLSDAPRTTVALEGYGLRIVGQRAIAQTEE